MKETIFEQVAAAASVLKLDLSAEEFALFAEDQEFSETGLEAVQMLFSYLSEKMYISNKLTISHGQSDHLSRRFRSLISERYSR